MNGTCHSYNLNIRRVCSTTLISKHLLEHGTFDFKTVEGIAGKNLCVQMNLFIAEGRTHEIDGEYFDFPTSWWDHIKHDISRIKWIPDWVTRWWTINYVHTCTVKKYIQVCPHLTVDPKEPEHLFHLFTDYPEVPPYDADSEVYKVHE